MVLNPNWPSFPGVSNMTQDSDGRPQTQDLIPGKQEGTPLEANFFNPLIRKTCDLQDEVDQQKSSLSNYATTVALQQEVTRAEAAEGSIQSALQQEVTRAEAAEAAILQLPAWVPIPCPLTTAPTGFLPADGRSFNTSKYPQLAVGYPNGVLPDLRGMFLRGLDTTGTVDNVPGGRQILSFEDGSLVCLGDNNNGNLSTFTGLGGSSVNTVLANYGYDLQLSNGVKSPLTAWVSNTTNYAGAEPVGITRPRNIAFNYIFRAA